MRALISFCALRKELGEPPSPPSADLQASHPILIFNLRLIKQYLVLVASSSSNWSSVLTTQNAIAPDNQYRPFLLQRNASDVQNRSIFILLRLMYLQFSGGGRTRFQLSSRTSNNRSRTRRRPSWAKSVTSPFKSPISKKPLRFMKACSNSSASARSKARSAMLFPCPTG